MDLADKHRKEVERRLVETIIDSLEKNLISVADKNSMSAFILAKMPSVTTQEGLITFLRELSSKWTIFSLLLVTESGEVKAKTEDQAVNKVEALAQEGKIDEALNMAKTAVNSTQS